ncbi:hypothetical protein BDB01DRAFT_451453 [Pilobolus umbonatus]|nr:hypothetical protein BDB01DRAFT_451453 [Pilobolus umbonatus]
MILKQMEYVDSLSDMFEKGRRIIEDGANKLKRKKYISEKGKRDEDGDYALRSLGPYTDTEGKIIGLCYEDGKTPIELKHYKFTVHCDCPVDWKSTKDENILNELKGMNNKIGLHLRVEIDGYVKEIALSSYKNNAKFIRDREKQRGGKAYFDFRRLHNEHFQMYKGFTTAMKTSSDIFKTLNNYVEAYENQNLRYIFRKGYIDKEPYSDHLMTEDPYIDY